MSVEGNGVMEQAEVEAVKAEAMNRIAKLEQARIGAASMEIQAILDKYGLQIIVDASPRVVLVRKSQA